MPTTRLSSLVQVLGYSLPGYPNMLVGTRRYPPSSGEEILRLVALQKQQLIWFILALGVSGDHSCL
jgi:hypothetical protein